MRRRAPALAALVLLAAGCGGSDAEPDTAAPAAEAAAGSSLTAAASVFPLAWLAEQIAPGAEVTFLGAGAAEAHDLDLTPSQRAGIETADVVLYMGDLGYQSQVEQAVGSASGEVVDVAEIAGPDRMLAAAEDDHGHEEEGEHAEEEGEHAKEEDGGLDPHVWFDAAVMAEVAERTGAAFAAADPDAADAFTANAERVADELRALDGELDETLAECRFDEAIVSHAAYGYLLSPRGIEQHAVVGAASGEAGASGSELAEIVAEVREEGFTHVLAEPVEGRADAEAVARETGIEMLDVFPLDVVEEREAEAGYPALLREQAAAFATALGCGP
ncbi:MAG TPA: metal ABC transporter substrate-binding protein [Mycobacteriales bacterium]|nr:metal ABC transporter substrate-binding protein [Mycobacteriales bacterium]